MARVANSTQTMTKPPDDNMTDFHIARGSKRIRQCNKKAQAKLTMDANKKGSHLKVGVKFGANLSMMFWQLLCWRRSKS